jgi:2-polyprenyl-6-methoxyphenol hydroxylase-like FAD-dependent oxidoreductase
VAELTIAVNLDVVIAGGGPGGSVAALALARGGARVTLLERLDRPAAAGGGILLHPNGLAVLYALGIGDALRRRAHISSAVAIRDERGRPILEMPVPYFGAGLDHMLAVRRSHLTAVLADAVAATPGIEVITGAEVIDVQSSGTASYRSRGDVHRLTADVVVGADGVHSTVRKRGAFGARSKTRRSIYVRGTVDDTGETGAAEAAEYWTPLGAFGVSPLGDGTTYFYADATAADVTAAIVDLDLERFRSVWAEVLPACRGVLDRIAGDGSLLVNAVQRVDCDTFVDGRLVLLGDAAHAMEPTLGQGANSAFVDAAVLAGELIATTSSEAVDVDHALTAYDARRRPAARSVQRAADRAARMAALHSSVAASVRNRFVRLVSASKVVEGRYRKLQQEDPAELFRAVSALPGRASMLQRLG